jgi:hypothetical protein
MLVLKLGYDQESYGPEQNKKCYFRLHSIRFNLKPDNSSEVRTAKHINYEYSVWF